ncbi:MAG: hypothetical protein QCI00_09105 [Candidatus Thermoplasmatota archaeon]|nr:hypothetical protein [Candidatus Thermoplasmatota archaeon]
MSSIIKRLKIKPMHLISIGFVLLLLLSSGCLDNNMIDETEPEATIQLPKDTFSKHEHIQFEIKNTGNTVLEFGRAFNIEYYDQSNNTWSRVDLDLVWTEEILVLYPAETFDEQTFHPASNFVGDVKEGEYRIKKNLNSANTGEKLELIKVFYIDMDEPYPNAALSLEKEDFDKADNIEYTVKNTGNTPLTFGRMFEIEFYDQDENVWEPVEMQMAVTLEMIILSPGGEFKQSFNPSEHFADDAEEGLYRISKSVTCTETEETLHLEKEFNIS